MHRFSHDFDLIGVKLLRLALFATVVLILIEDPPLRPALFSPHPSNYDPLILYNLVLRTLAEGLRILWRLPFKGYGHRGKSLVPLIIDGGWGPCRANIPIDHIHHLILVNVKLKFILRYPV